MASSPTIHKSKEGKMDQKLLRTLLEEHPIPEGVSYAYGTAGFRYDASILPCVFVRMGIFAAIRSASMDGQQVGLMVTASHNKESDNGIKLSDPSGGMLHPTWERHAVTLANSTTPFECIETLLSSSITNKNKQTKKMMIHIGRDTRSHSKHLSDLAIQSALAMGGGDDTTVIIYDHGCVTTPQLHHFVMHGNSDYLPGLIPQRGMESGYLEIMTRSYHNLIRTKEEQEEKQNQEEERVWMVDGACGVGTPKIRMINEALKRLKMEDAEYACQIATFETVNMPGDGPLNDGCGAEFVQKNRLPPKLYSDDDDDDSVGKSSFPFASLDGDADRIVFHYYRGKKKEFRLLDGDKIAILISSFIQDELRCLDDGAEEEVEGVVRCGVVQTAYANGASTLYLKNKINTQVQIAKTGVKYVHQAAHDHFDVGVYFEANGHGTVLFGPAFYDHLARSESRLLRNSTTSSSSSSSSSSRAKLALRRLRILPSLINQSVGDAISDLLLVDAILCLKKGWGVGEMMMGVWYEDVPSRQCKIKVLDRSIIKTNDNETKTILPETLQPALDAAMAKILPSSSSSSSSPPPRCFVRPSGTENVVRVYAEASTMDDANELAFQTCCIVYDLCGGVGDRPVKDVVCDLKMK